VQHRQAGTAHPQALGGRSDFDGRTDENTDGVTVTDTGGGEASGDAAGTLVHLAPRVPYGFERLTRDHATGADARVLVHLVGEPAHEDLLSFWSDSDPGFDAIPASMLRLAATPQKEARANN